VNTAPFLTIMRGWNVLLLALSSSNALPYFQVTAGPFQNMTFPIDMVRHSLTGSNTLPEMNNAVILLEMFLFYAIGSNGTLDFNSWGPAVLPIIQSVAAVANVTCVRTQALTIAEERHIATKNAYYQSLKAAGCSSFFSC